MFPAILFDFGLSFITLIVILLYFSSRDLVIWLFSPSQEVMVGGILDLHVIVGGPCPNDFKIKYRRQYFLDYLASNSRNRVIWISSRNHVSVNDLGSVEKAQCSIHENVTYLTVKDCKFIVANIEALQLRISNSVKSICSDDVYGQKNLWYTLPRYSALAGSHKWDRIHYDISDNWVGQYKGRFLKLLNYLLTSKTERKIIDVSDSLSASSVFLKEKFEVIKNDDISVVPNGVDFSFVNSFVTKELSLVDEGNNIFFVGTLEPSKIDIKHLYFFAKSLEGFTFTLIGPLTDVHDEESSLVDNLLSLPNVKHFSFMERHLLYKLLAKASVALLPYIDCEFNKGIFPLKTFEYQALGIPVIYWGLSPKNMFLDRGLFLLERLNPEDFETLLVKVLEISTPAYRESLSVNAMEYDWKEVFKGIISYE